MPTLAGSAAWSQWVDQARNADILAVARSLGAMVKQCATAEFEGPCLVCGGRDRFSVNVKKRICNCRKCGLAGNVIAMVMGVTGSDFVEACEFINKTPRPDRSRDETLQDKSDRLSIHALRQTQYREREEEERRTAEAKAKLDEEAIALVLDRSQSLAGTYGEAYLKGRGLTPHPRLTGDIRFVPDLDYWGTRDNGTRSVVLLATLPAIVARIRSFSGETIGISQTYLDPKEPRKWRPEGSPTNSAKKVRGEKKNGTIRLGRSAATMAIGEGWENCLAFHQLGFGPEDLGLAAAVDLGNLAGGATGHWPHPVLKDGDGRPVRIRNGIPDPQHRGIILPDGTKSVILLADLDSETYATMASLRVAGNRFVSEGVQVDIAWPSEPGKDWNDILIAQMEEYGGPVNPGASVRTD